MELVSQARISRCSLARDRTDERSVRSNDMTTDDIDQQSGGYNINERRQNGVFSKDRCL
jgi:hypothetical protein